MNRQLSFLESIGHEFKQFALRGNVIDLAVGIIIGGAFNKIVGSLVSDIITPPLGFLMGKIQLSDFYIALSSREFSNLLEAKEAGVPVIAYGIFLDSLIAFLITAFAVFLLVKSINTLKAKYEKEPEKTPTSKPCPFCYTSISIKATRCPACTSHIEEV